MATEFGKSPQEMGGEASLHGTKISAAELQLYLKGVSYPVDKNRLIDHARSNNAPDTVMGVLRRLPDRQYTRPADIEEEFSKIK